MQRSWRTASKHGAALLPALALLLGGIERRWIGDDGFINLRVVQQLLAGNGFVFNAGERVEAVTSPLWVFLLTGLGGLGVPLAQGTTWLGLTLSTVGLLLCGYASIYASRVDEEEGPLLWLPFGTLAYAAIPAAWDYASSGLENGLGLFWLGLSALMTAVSAAHGRSATRFWAALVLGMAPLVRPDCALIGLPLGLVLLSQPANLRQRVGLSALGALPGLSFQIFRMGYFAALVPNTALAKEAFHSYWEQGGHYLWNTLGLYLLLWPLACLALGLFLTSRQSRAPQSQVRWALALGGFLHCLYIVRMGGDFMHARLLLPGLAAIFSALGVLPFTRAPRWQAAAQGLVFAALFAWVVVCATSLRVSRENEFGIGDERGWFARESGVPNPVEVEDYQHFLFYTEMLEPKREIARGCPRGEIDLQASSRAPCLRQLVVQQPLADGVKVLPLREGAVPPEVVAVMVVGPLGIPAAVLGLRIHVVDAFGLADPIGARVQLNGRGRPGHEKHLPDAWRAARYAVLSSTRDPEVHALSEVLACRPLHALIRAVRAPMSPSRFWENMKLSFAFHRLRLATDSRQAREQLCARSL